MRYALVFFAVLIGGCAIHAREPVTTNPKMKVVKVDGEDIMVAPYSDGTWGATDRLGSTWVPPNPAIVHPRLRRAIEVATGCRVVHSDFFPDLSNVIAAVDCGK